MTTQRALDRRRLGEAFLLFGCLMSDVLVFLIFHAIDDSNELAQAIKGNFLMLLCKDGEVSAPNLRTYFKVRSYASKACIIK